MRRRTVLIGGTVLAMPAAAAEGLAALEARQGGRLGVAILDSGSGRMMTHRGEERFALCSTFKFLAAGLVLARVDRGEERLDRHIAYGREALVPYSPATGPGAEAGGLTMGAICDAAVTLSDNTAGNLMLGSFGGPEGLTGWLRGLGDPMTRLDRWEPDLNLVPAGEEQDTTTPLAMVGTMQRLLLGEALSAASREQLAAWLVGCRTGDARLRAGLPPSWRVGDKTGTGPAPLAPTCDVAIAWPPGRAPILIAAYLDGARGTNAERSAVLAEVGRIAARVG